MATLTPLGSVGIDQAELAHLIDEGQSGEEAIAAGSDKIILDVDAVHGDVGERSAQTIDDPIPAGANDGAGNTRLQVEQSKRVPVQQGKLRDLPGLDDVAHNSAGGVHQLRASLDRDGLRHRAHFQPNRRNGVLRAGIQPDIRYHACREAGGSHLDPVRAAWK